MGAGGTAGSCGAGSEVDDVVVRPGVPADAPGVARCHGACWREAYSSLVPPGFFDATPDGLGTERWGELLATAEVTVVVAVRGAEVVGLASAGPPSDAGEPDGSPAPPGRRLHALYLRARLHGSGVADGLLVDAVGPGPASLWVLEDNPRARAFYARHGFAPDGRRTVDAWTGLVEVRMARP